MPRTADDCASTDSPRAPAANTAISVSRNHIGTSLNRRASGGGAVREFAAVGKRDLFEQRRRFASAERRHDHGDLISGLEHVELPPGAVEDARARAFNEPVPLPTCLFVRR